MKILMKLHEPAILLAAALIIALAAVIGTCSLCYWKDRAQRAEAAARVEDAQVHATLAARNKEIAHYQGALSRCQDDVHKTNSALTHCQLKCLGRFIDRAIEQGVRLP